jgi:hypothetical protein
VHKEWRTANQADQTAAERIVKLPQYLKPTPAVPSGVQSISPAPDLHEQHKSRLGLCCRCSAVKAISDCDLRVGKAIAVAARDIKQAAHVKRQRKTKDPDDRAISGQQPCGKRRNHVSSLCSIS